MPHTTKKLRLTHPNETTRQSTVAEKKTAMPSTVKKTRVRPIEALENQAKKVPANVFLWAALGSIATSAILQFTKKRHLSLFVGEWVPTLLLFGVYNKVARAAAPARSKA